MTRTHEKQVKEFFILQEYINSVNDNNYSIVDISYDAIQGVLKHQVLKRKTKYVI